MAESRLERMIEDFILVYLIVTKLLQFFGFIHIFEGIGLYREFFDLIDIVVSMAGLGYVLYKSSLTEIFFGEKNKLLDLLLLVFYFLLITNKFVEFSRIIIQEGYNIELEEGICQQQDTRFLAPFICFLATGSIEQIAFYMGTFGLVLISIYAAFRLNIIEPSILNALHEDNKTKKLTKFISSFFVLIGFYLIFFNLITEWFTKVLDAPLILIAIFLYIFKFHGFGKSMDVEYTLFKITDFVESITEGFIGLFHSKKTIFLGISAMLVLHLISDLGSFIIPYNLGLESSYSFEGLKEDAHMSFFQLFSLDKEIVTDNGMQIFLVLGYILNTIGALFLILFPGFIWYIIYINHVKEKKESMIFPNILLALFFACLIYMRFLPTYKITSLFSETRYLLGADIQTQSILNSGNSIVTSLIISSLIFIFVLILSNIGLIKDILFFIISIISIGFFGIYVYYYFTSILFFNQAVISEFISYQLYYNVFFYLIFMMITAMFYVGGYLSFIISIFKD